MGCPQDMQVDFVLLFDDSTIISILMLQEQFWSTKAEMIIQGGFFNWSALKMTKCQITCKSLQKSSKCQNFLRVWHLVIFRADQLKKPPCIIPKNTIMYIVLFSYYLEQR